MSDCPVLTRMVPPLPQVITKDLVTELLVSTYDTAPGSEVTVSCQLNLVLQGVNTVTCTAAGIWNVSPLPTCVVPTTTAAPEMYSVDEPLTLMIALGVVAVLILAIIVIILVALCYDHHKRRNRKRLTKREYSYYGDSTTHVNSISERAPAERPGAVCNVFTGPAADYDNRPAPPGYMDMGVHREPRWRDGGDREIRARDNGDRESEAGRVYTVDRASARDETAFGVTGRRDVYDVPSTSGRRVVLNYPQYYQGRSVFPYGGTGGVVFPHSYSDIYPEIGVERAKVKENHKQESDNTSFICPDYSGTSLNGTPCDHPRVSSLEMIHFTINPNRLCSALQTEDSGYFTIKVYDHVVLTTTTSTETSRIHPIESGRRYGTPTCGGKCRPIGRGESPDRRMKPSLHGCHAYP